MAKRKANAEAAIETAVETSTKPAEYTVLARRYRPQQFSDLVGQEPVAQALSNALTSGRVAHAYLFTGARGVGKTSTARILAKALNCEKGPTVTPCDQCEMCQSITSGEDVDVLEIDGASNNGVDQVREIRQNVALRPARGRYKIYIIDEVHMLSTAAFNALLKTLEEPPAHVKFIFATTEINKIPITILSRCQRFDFAGIGTTRILEHLKEIVAQEKMQADDDALELIARRGAGSMRDAQSLLDQLLSFSTDRLTADQVHRLLGTAGEERIAGLTDAIVARDAGQALALLGQALDEGIQPGELIEQLIDTWRDLMVLQAAPTATVFSVVGAGRERLKKYASATKPDTILAGLDVLVNAKQRLRFTTMGRVVLELAVVRLCRLDDLVPLAQLATWVAENQPPQVAGRAAPARAAAPVSSAGRPSGPAAPATEKKKLSDAPITTSGPLTQESLTAVWPQILIEVGFVLQSELRRAEVAISGPNNLVLRLVAGYNAWDPSKIAKVEQAILTVTGQACKVAVEELAKGSAPTAAPAVVAKPTAELSSARTKRQREEALAVPIVSKAKELLGAQIVQMDEDFGLAPIAPTEPASVDAPLADSDTEED